jgi:hypothetical protein
MCAEKRLFGAFETSAGGRPPQLRHQLNVFYLGPTAGPTGRRIIPTAWSVLLASSTIWLIAEHFLLIVATLLPVYLSAD